MDTFCSKEISSHFILISSILPCCEQHTDYDVDYIYRALSLASSEVRFHINSKTHDPIDVQTKELW